MLLVSLSQILSVTNESERPVARQSLLTANASTNNVSVIYIADSTVIGTVSVGAEPEEVAVGDVPKVEYVTPGSTWTLNVETAFCEVQTFSAGGTWASDNYGDAGTWTGGGKSLNGDFTRGDDAGAYIATTYSTANKGYSGTGMFGGMSFPVTVSEGAQPGC